MPGLQALGLVCVAYLIGSIPFGLLVAQAVGRVDIRRYGSGNIGTANVLRTVGKRAAVLTLLGDLCKGLFPALAALLLGGSDRLVAGVGLAAVVGHNWPIYLWFAGGKGVATTFGALLVMTPVPALLGLLVWLAVVLTSRYTSLGALIASLLVPPVVLLVSGPGPYFAFSLIATVLIFVRHRDNIRRLVAGTEHRVGRRVREG
jgi:glycerol-3-phosphate acyltransferase PlsY